MITYESHKHSTGLLSSKIGKEDSDGLVDSEWPGIGLYTNKKFIVLLGQHPNETLKVYDVSFYYKPFSKGGVLVMVQE
jgi:hypothetical protein